MDLAFLLADSGAAAFRLLSAGRATAAVTVGFATAFFFLLLGRGVLAIVLRCRMLVRAPAAARPAVARGRGILTDPYQSAIG